MTDRIAPAPLVWPPPFGPVSPHRGVVQIVDAEAGLVVCTPRRTKVAILAFAQPQRGMAPVDDPTWEVWGLNAGWVTLARDSERRFRADRWWDLHPIWANTDEELHWLRDCPVPIYMPDASPFVPNAVRYPIERVLAMGYREYFTCTFAYQIALAILEGFTTIGLFGVELINGTARERTVERAAVDYWVGVAQGRGIHVVFPSSSRIAWHPWKYGIDYRAEVHWVNAWLEQLAMMAAPWESEPSSSVHGVSCGSPEAS